MKRRKQGVAYVWFVQVMKTVCQFFIVYCAQFCCASFEKVDAGSDDDKKATKCARIKFTNKCNFSFSLVVPVVLVVHTLQLSLAFQHIFTSSEKREVEKRKIVCLSVCGVSILGVLLGRHPVSFNEYLVNIYLNSVFRSILSTSVSRRQCC